MDSLFNSMSSFIIRYTTFLEKITELNIENEDFTKEFSDAIIGFHQIGNVIEILNEAFNKFESFHESNFEFNNKKVSIIDLFKFIQLEILKINSLHIEALNHKLSLSLINEIIYQINNIKLVKEVLSEPNFKWDNYVLKQMDILETKIQKKINLTNQFDNFELVESNKTKLLSQNNTTHQLDGKNFDIMANVFLYELERYYSEFKLLGYIEKGNSLKTVSSFTKNINDITITYFLIDVKQYSLDYNFLELYLKKEDGNKEVKNHIDWYIKGIKDVYFKTNDELFEKDIIEVVLNIILEAYFENNKLIKNELSYLKKNDKIPKLTSLKFDSNIDVTQLYKKLLTHNFICPDSIFEDFKNIENSEIALKPIKWISTNKLLAYLLDILFKNQEWQSISDSKKIFINKNNKTLNKDDLSVAKHNFSQGYPKGHNKIDLIIKEIKNINNIKTS